MWAAAILTAPAFAQEKKEQPVPPKKEDPKKPDAPKSQEPKKDEKGAAPGQSDEQKMMAEMMALMQPGDNHKLLEALAGEWSYTIRHWMDPDPSAPPQESTGTAVSKSILGGRYIQQEVAGRFQMPGPDGKMTDYDFKGIGITGYDNVKKKFFNTWFDNMGTGVMVSEGTYDPATKTYTYAGEYEMMPGMTMKARYTLKIIDKDKHVFEWYESMAGAPERKSMEIAYSRKQPK
jgi:hypothetical protein